MIEVWAPRRRVSARWLRWIASDADAPVQDAVNAGARLVLVALDGDDAVGALHGTPTAFGYRILGLRTRDEGAAEIAGALLEALHDRSPGQVIEASLPVEEASAAVDRQLEQAGYRDVGRRLRFARRLDDLSTPADDSLSHRTLRECGVEQFVEVARRCLEPEHSRDEELLEWLETARAREREDLWSVVEQAGRSVGVALLELAGPVGTVRFLGVLPELRGRGLGKALHRSILERLRSRGATRYLDSALEGNLPLRRVLASNGCAPSGTLRLWRRPAPTWARDSSGGALATLVEWLQDRGARAPALRLVQLPYGGRGVEAAEEIAAEQVIVSVPRRCFLTLDLARESRVGRRIAACAEALESQYSVLAAFLLVERRDPTSFWKPYLDALPRDFATNPIHYGARELELLEGTSIEREAPARRDSIRRDHERLARVPGFDFDYDDFAWARLVIASRVFDLPLDGARRAVLVPFADMLDHGQPCEAGWQYSEAAGCYQIVAFGPIPRGANVTQSYGRKSNAQLLLGYGFVLEANDSEDQFLVELDVPRETGFLALRRRLLLLRGEETSRELKVRETAEHGGLAAALGFLRIALADRRELEILASRPAIAGRDPIGIALEGRVLGALADACRRKLAVLNARVARDEQLRGEPGLETDARQCLVLRRSETRALERTIAFVETVRSHVVAGDREALAALEGGPWESYARKALVEAIDRDPWVVARRRARSAATVG